MERLLVGGYVRDRLIGRPARERDWVVLASTPDILKSQGYIQVGSHFPVFLHPQTKEEHALARIERKVAGGHTGFSTLTENVRLEDDLLRRDLTINAMALDSEGKLHDPHGGMRDLQGRWLRHVSSAFAADPLRVLRVARFAAQLAPWGFKVAPATLQKMREVGRSYELTKLSWERVWLETSKALMTEKPSVYFYTLRDCGALAILFAEIEGLFGVPQHARHHPEIDCGLHTMMVIDQAARAQLDICERLAALVHDLGKAVTPQHILPGHRGHEAKGLPLVKEFCSRLRLPVRTARLAERCCAEHLHCHRAFELRPDTLCDLFTRLDGWRNPSQVTSFTKVCTADARGRTGYEDAPYSQAGYLRDCHQAALRVDTKSILTGISEDKLKAAAIRKGRIEAIARLKKQHTRVINKAS